MEEFHKYNGLLLLIYKSKMNAIVLKLETDYKLHQTVKYKKAVIATLIRTSENEFDIIDNMSNLTTEFYKLSTLFLKNEMFEQVIMCNKIIDIVVGCACEAAKEVYKYSYTPEQIEKIIIGIKAGQEQLKSNVAEGKYN